MANKVLKSIKFPGLNDTYTIPQVDNTLAVSGAAADAKKTGDAIGDLKSAADLIASVYPDKIKSTVLTSGKYVNINNGVIGDQPTWTCTGYIPVKPNTEYTLKRASMVNGGCYTTADATGFETDKIIALNSGTTDYVFTTGANTHYVVVSFPTTYIDYVKLYEGTPGTNTLNADLVVPQLSNYTNTTAMTALLKSYTANYSSDITVGTVSQMPNADNVFTNTIYRMYFANGSTSDNFPAGLPLKRWIHTIGYLYVFNKSSGSNVGCLQIFICDGCVFTRYYSSAWSKWDAIKCEVDVGSTGCPFTSLSEAIAWATQYKNAVVNVKSGTYNIETELKALYGDDYFTNYSTSSNPRGIILHNGIRLIFASNSKVVFNYTGSNSAVKTEFSVFNFLGQTLTDGFTIENATVECSNCRYVVHDDPGNNANPYKNTYKNCNFLIDNRNNTEWTSTKCIGGGLGQSGDIRIKDCVFSVIGTPNTNAAIVSYHVDTYTTSGKNHVAMSGCYLNGGTFAAIYGGNSADFIVTNNSLYGNVLIVPVSSGADGSNIHVYAWNNINRASSTLMSLQQTSDELDDGTISGDLTETTENDASV